MYMNHGVLFIQLVLVELIFVLRVADGTGVTGVRCKNCTPRDWRATNFDVNNGDQGSRKSRIFRWENQLISLGKFDHDLTINDGECKGNHPLLWPTHSG